MKRKVKIENKKLGKVVRVFGFGRAEKPVKRRDKIGGQKEWVMGKKENKNKGGLVTGNLSSYLPSSWKQKSLELFGWLEWKCFMYFNFNSRD